ncbi:MAG: TolB family protein, partial [Burkholderiales bacterium]
MLVELPDEARLPSWSPDGRWLAFQHFVEGQWRIFVIGRDGKGLRQLTSGAADDREPVWTADGKALLFSSDRSGNFDIWKVAASGGTPERITSATADEYFPAVSADGRIAFVSATAKGRDLVVREASGDRVLLSSPDELALPSWSKRGDRLAYVEYRRGRPGRDPGSSAINVVTIATGTATRQSGETEDVFVTRPQWAAENTLLYTADGKIRQRSGTRASDIHFAAEFTVMRVPEYRYKRQDFFSANPRAVKGIVA